MHIDLSLSNGSFIFKNFMQAFSSIIIVSSLAIILFLFHLFFKNKTLIKNPVNIFIINLILVDFLKSLIHLPLFCINLEAILNPASELRSKTDFICNLNLILTILFETVQLYSFIAISYERLRMVNYPLLLAAKRLRLSLILLILTWTLSISTTVLFYLIVSYHSNFVNINQNQCYLDLFHLLGSNNFDNSNNYSSNLTLSSNLDANYLEFEKQNEIIDIYHLVFTFITIGITFLIYLRILILLKEHDRKLSQHIEPNTPNPEPKTITKYIRELYVKNIILIQKPKNQTVPVKNDLILGVNPHKLDTIKTNPNPEIVYNEIITDNHNKVVSDDKPDENFVTNLIDKPLLEVANQLEQNNDNNDLNDREKTSSSNVSNPKNLPVQICDENGCVKTQKKVFFKNNKVEGDICIVSKNGANKEIGKRRLEARMTKKTFIIMVSFVSCRVFYIMAVLIRTSDHYFVFDAEILHLNSYLEIFFTILSFFSCFVNALSFIIVTEYFRNLTKDYILKLSKNFIKNNKVSSS